MDAACRLAAKSPVRVVVAQSEAASPLRHCLGNSHRILVATHAGQLQSAVDPQWPTPPHCATYCDAKTPLADRHPSTHRERAFPPHPASPQDLQNRPISQPHGLPPVAATCQPQFAVLSISQYQHPVLESPVKRPAEYRSRCRPSPDPHCCSKRHTANRTLWTIGDRIYGRGKPRSPRLVPSKFAPSYSCVRLHNERETRPQLRHLRLSSHCSD